MNAFQKKRKFAQDKKTGAEKKYKQRIIEFNLTNRYFRKL